MHHHSAWVNRLTTSTGQRLRPEGETRIRQRRTNGTESSRTHAVKTSDALFRLTRKLFKARQPSVHQCPSGRRRHPKRLPLGVQRRVQRFNSARW